MSDQQRLRARHYAFGNLLLRLRTRASLTQGALANDVGVHLRSVQNWEQGVAYPKAETLQRLIVVLLRRRAFAAGGESVEAEALWTRAAEDSARNYPTFDASWFAHAISASLEPPPAAPVTDSLLQDWGEATAVPALFGRERELATLQEWIEADRCRVVTLLGLGGIGKSSLALHAARRVAPRFDAIFFRSLQNGPSVDELLGQAIRSLSRQQASPPAAVPDKIAALVELLRERRCLLILDNFEAILQPGALSGTYRSGYAAYGLFLQALSTRSHQSCLLLTSREKPAELGPMEGPAAPVRTLPLSGLGAAACQELLATRALDGSPESFSTLGALYGGNPLALQLVAEPVRELFGGDIATFLAADTAFFGSVGALLEQQIARSTTLEQAIIYWLAVGRELLPFSALLERLGEAASSRELLAALESLRRRMLIERGTAQPSFTLQPVILEFVTDRLIELVTDELVGAAPELLCGYPLAEATVKEYVRHSQERLIVTPVLERLGAVFSGERGVERQLVRLLDLWRGRPQAEQGYGPGNVVNLLRLLRGHLRGLNLARLQLRQLYLLGVEAQDTSLAGATLRDFVATDVFDGVITFATSANGASWALADGRGAVQVWAAERSALYRRWPPDADITRHVALSPDGQRLASASWDGAVRVRDLASGATRWSVSPTNGSIDFLRFSPDGALLATYGEVESLLLRDAADGGLRAALPHPTPVAAIVWNAEATMLASGAVDGTIRLWAIQPGGGASCVQEYIAHAGVITGLAFAPDGRTLASASWDATVKLWDVGSGALRETIAHQAAASRVDWHPDGLLLASSSQGVIQLWEVAQRRVRAVLYGHSGYIRGLEFTPDGAGLLSASEDGVIRLWEVASAHCLRLIQGYTTALMSIDWNADGTALVSGSIDGRVTRWDAAGRSQLLQKVSRHTFVAWGALGTRIAVTETAADGIVLLDTRSNTPIDSIPLLDGVSNMFGLSCSPDGERLAFVSLECGAQLYHLPTRQLITVQAEFTVGVGSTIGWSPDGTQFSAADIHGMVWIWRAVDGTTMRQLTGHQGAVLSVTWSEDGTRLASLGNADDGSELIVWDAQQGCQVVSLAGPPGSVGDIAWGAVATQLITGGADGKLRWWDLERAACVRTVDAHEGVVQQLRRNPDGTRLASCGFDGTIKLWDLASGELLKTLREDRPYERMDLTDAQGLSEAQLMALRDLGAVTHALE